MLGLRLPGIVHSCLLSRENMKEKLIALGTSAGTFGAAIATVFASLCCVGPAAFAILGATGVTFAALLTPFRLYLLAASVLLLGYGFWRVYRPATSSAGAVCPARVGRPMRLMLWGSLVFWVAAALAFAATELPRLTGPKAATSEHKSLGADAEALRAAFNADAGKTRVVMLVSPT